MNNLNNCKNIIKTGIILRYTITILLFIYIYIRFNGFVKKNIYFILPIALTLLDFSDNIILWIYRLLQSLHYSKYNENYDKCSYHFYYQYLDKICDSLSYLLTFLLLCLYFKPDFILLFFIFYRIIGVILFCTTNNSTWLVAFFDFIKEYLLYLFIFNKNYSYIPICIFLKICFEFYIHKINNRNYLLDNL